MVVYIFNPMGRGAPCLLSAFGVSSLPSRFRLVSVSLPCRCRVVIVIDG